jgi:hypothetical protein
MKIVNFHDYGSRENLPEGAVYVGRPNRTLAGSPLANPYHIRPKLSRHEAIQRYRRWLFDKINKSDRKVMTALSELNEDSVLVCWCSPNPCHAEVIERAWNYCKEKGLIGSFSR